MPMAAGWSAVLWRQGCRLVVSAASSNRLPTSMAARMSAFRSKWERLLGKTESPIESIFLEVFCPAALEHGYEVAKESAAPHSVIIIKTQYWIDRYRADFLIRYRFYDEIYEAVVECDGHQFHEKTKAQALRDRRRDRHLQQAGFEVFRFTGSEINGSPRLCAAEVLDCIMDFQTRVFVRTLDASQREAA